MLQPKMPVATTIQAKFQQGVLLHQQGKLVEAERLYEEVLRQMPTYFGALHLLGIIALQTRRTQRGVELITRAIGLNENVAAAYCDLGTGLNDLKRFEEALKSCDKAIALKPGYAEAYCCRGTRPGADDFRKRRQLRQGIESLTSRRPIIGERAQELKRSRRRSPATTRRSH